ncbi:ALS2 C-terminal-like protein isoform X1 [Hypanus sabinus]|uniref:ALS2 C-terminal-like protein isoform X1 n=1 Tax=Hypanus sabinus TaxID=79690 RepID=UPI0028C45E2C|nr:ALS2 C-terminal-like protein isoform X1 [Hypanus sabinus]XP_059830368.1 ALS2 C-terminal-like protein isoform X1 [Hypanus sabinus]
MDQGCPVQRADSDVRPQKSSFSINWMTPCSKSVSNSRQAANLGPDVKEKCQREAAYLFKMEQSFKNLLSDIKTKVLQPLVKAEASDPKSQPQLKESLFVLAESLEALCNQTEENCSHLSERFDTSTHKELYLLKNAQHLKEMYIKYFMAFSNYVVLSGFEHIAKQTSDYWKKNKQTLKYFHLDSTSLPMSLHRILHEPVCLQIQKYVNIIRKLSRGLIKNPETKPITDALATFTDLNKWIQQTLDVASLTKALWNSLGSKLTDLLFLPERRLREEGNTISASSRDVRLLLFDDSLVAIQGSEASSYKLNTVWMERLADTSSERNLLKIIVPEEEFVLNMQDSKSMMVWVWKLNQAIRQFLNGKLDFPLWGENRTENSCNVSACRFAAYTFVNNPRFKDGTYEGDWYNGKPQGSGIMKWPCGRNYAGQYEGGLEQGFGVYVTPGGPESFDCYKCHWKMGKMHGYGICEYGNGMVYKGYFQDNQRHGFGILHNPCLKKQAFKYMGHWENNKKTGYGVLDDPERGERYIGSWLEDCKHGRGIVITQSGVSYEGKFQNNKIIGPGTILSEDDAAYEGEFTEDLDLTGKGKLTFSNGYFIEGLFSSKWGSGLKTNGIFSKPPNELESLITSKLQLGSHLIPANDRWQGIYDQFWEFLKSGSDESSMESFLGFYSENGKENRKNLKNRVMVTEVDTTYFKCPEKFLPCDSPNDATSSEKITQNQGNLALLNQLKEYLKKAFGSNRHPLGKLLQTLILVFQDTFSGICMCKRLLSMAQQEVVSHANKLFELSRYFLPKTIEKECYSAEGQISEELNAYTVVLPLILPRFYPDLFMLYMLYHEDEDSRYWKGILHLEYLSDTKLLEFLEVQKNLWPLQDLHLTNNQRISIVKDVCFTSAILCFQKISSTADPQDKLDTIMKTYQEIEKTVTRVLNREYKLPMDDLLPLLVYVVSRAKIQHLGAELHLIRDMMDPSTEGGMSDFLLTALDSCYQHIQKEEIRTSILPE